MKSFDKKSLPEPNHRQNKVRQSLIKGKKKMKLYVVTYKDLQNKHCQMKK